MGVLVRLFPVDITAGQIHDPNDLEYVRPVVVDVAEGEEGNKGDHANAEAVLTPTSASTVPLTDVSNHISTSPA